MRKQLKTGQYKHTYKDTCTHIDPCTHIDTCTSLLTTLCWSSSALSIHVRTHRYTQKCMCAFIVTCIQTLTHTRTYIHSHMHTYHTHSNNSLTLNFVRRKVLFKWTLIVTIFSCFSNSCHKLGCKVCEAEKFCSSGP